jgi:hypothetical protein
MKFSVYGSIFLVIIAACCSFPEVKSPKFTRDYGSVITDLQKLGGFETANIKSSTRSFDNKTTSTLTIELINGEALPGNDELKALGKEAAKIVLASMENAKDYQSFRVEFVSKQSMGIASASNSTSFEYDAADIK